MQYMSEIYPRKNDKTMVYLKPIIKNPMICIGDYTYYHDALNDPKEFEYRNVLYQAPINNDKLIIGKFCSIAQGATFMLNCANHKMTRYSVYPFNLLFDLWGLPKEERKPVSALPIPNCKTHKNSDQALLPCHIYLHIIQQVCRFSATLMQPHGQLPQVRLIYPSREL